MYVEKPLAHNIKEGRAMVEAARHYNRIVQTGTQQRSAPHYRDVAGIIQSGARGEVRYVRVWNFSNMFPYGIRQAPDSDIPEGLDWDFYLGPAPQVPFKKNRFLRNYRWYWDYAVGNIAYKTRKKLLWDAGKEDFKEESAASQLLGRKARRPWDLI